MPYSNSNMTGQDDISAHLIVDSSDSPTTVQEEDFLLPRRVPMHAGAKRSQWYAMNSAINDRLKKKKRILRWLRSYTHLVSWRSFFHLLVLCCIGSKAGFCHVWNWTYCYRRLLLSLSPPPWQRQGKVVEVAHLSVAEWRREKDSWGQGGAGFTTFRAKKSRNVQNYLELSCQKIYLIIVTSIS